jgi:ankyrin repeat protein
MSTSIRDLILQNDPLAAAILLEDAAELEHLLLEGRAPNVNYKVLPTSKTPLLLAVGPASVHTLMVEHLLDHGGADVELGESCHQITPLMAACNVENYSLVELLLQRGAQPNAQSVDGKTALIQMAKLGNLNLVRLLLQWGANPSIYDEQAKNALMYACSENRIEIVRFLLQHIDNNNNNNNAQEASAAGRRVANDYKVDTPLWYACAAGHMEVVKVLIEEGGAKIEYRLDGTVYSTTPLMEACEWGHFQVVQLLLEHGADVSSLTGRKALALARRSGYHKVEQLMEFWTKRLRELQSFLEAGGPADQDTVPASLVPLILSQTGKRPQLTHVILSLRVDVLASRG